MPELPEVEVTRRILSPLVVQRVIREVRVSKPSYFFLTPPATLRRALASKVIGELRRVGKYLVASLSDESQLLLHLGMTGQLFSSEAASPRLLSSTAGSSLTPQAQTRFQPDVHTHLHFRFADGGPDVFFRDVRKFGKVQLLKPGQSCERLDRLGPDALTISAGQLQTAARQRRTPVKTLLLDQSVLAGVGNIYADEALFLAGIKPMRPANKVTQKEWQSVARAIQRVLQRSIETGGSSISDYLRPDGKDGGYQDERKVYGLEGEPCQSCRSPIRRVVIATRSTSYCENCQR